jgi:hypothetical protein
MKSESDVASLIAVIYEAGMDFNLWPYALGRIASVFGAPSAGIARQGRTLSECWGFSSAIDPDCEQKYIDYYHSVNPIWQRASATPVGTVQTDTMVMPRRELGRTEFFNDFLVPQQMESMLNAVVVVEEGRQTVVTVRRNPEFEADDVQLYKLLAPHLQRAVQINIKLAKAEVNQSSGRRHSVCRPGRERKICKPGGRALFCKWRSPSAQGPPARGHCSRNSSTPCGNCYVRQKPNSAPIEGLCFIATPRAIAAFFASRAASIGEFVLTYADANHGGHFRQRSR